MVGGTVQWERLVCAVGRTVREEILYLYSRRNYIVGKTNCMIKGTV